LTGYRILTPQNVILGSVTQLIENPGQLLLSVKTEEGRVILVPFHEDLIVKYDRKKKLIIMDLPEGLQEINR
jgi:16S rRNA processing protein RimM